MQMQLKSIDYRNQKVQRDWVGWNRQKDYCQISEDIKNGEAPQHCGAEGSLQEEGNSLFGVLVRSE